MKYSKIILSYFKKYFTFFNLKIIIAYILIVFITSIIYTFNGGLKTVKEGYKNAKDYSSFGDIFDPAKNGIGATMDPNKNGFADAFSSAFDPEKNGFAKTFDPNRNGMTTFFNDIGDQTYTYGDKLTNDTIDNFDNSFIFFEIFLKKTIPEFFNEFLNGYWQCFLKILFNLYKCIWFYLLEVVGQVLYLPFRFLIWMFCLYSYEKQVWSAIDSIDNGVACFVGFHIFHYPDSIIEQCYTCKVKENLPEIKAKPSMKVTQAPPSKVIPPSSLYTDKNYISKLANKTINPSNNGVADAINPDKNGVSKKFKYIVSKDNKNSFIKFPEKTGYVFADAGEFFGKWAEKEIGGFFTKTLPDKLKDIFKI